MISHVFNLKEHCYPLGYEVCDGDIVTGLSVRSFVRASVRNNLVTYTEHPSIDLNQTWYTVSIRQGLEASRSKLDVEYRGDASAYFTFKLHMRLTCDL